MANHTSESTNKKSNIFVEKFLEMREKGPDPWEFMRGQFLLWGFLWFVVAMFPALQLIIGENFKFGTNIAMYKVIVSICAARYLFFFVAWIIKFFFYYSEKISQQTFKALMHILCLEGTVVGMALFGRKKFIQTEVHFHGF